MPATNEGLKLDDQLAGLGEGFRRVVAAHIQRHEESGPEAIRRQKLAEWEDKLKFVNISDSRPGYQFYSPHVRVGEAGDKGTKISANLHTSTLLGSDPVGGLHEVITKLADRAPGELGEQYVKKGPASGRLEELGATGTFGPEAFKTGEALKELAKFGVELSATLVTSHEGLEDGTVDEDVFLGTLIDPESILVPEYTADAAAHGPRAFQQKSFSIIGPEDARFDYITGIVERVIAGSRQPSGDPSLGT